MTADPANFTIVDAIHKVGRAHGMKTLAKCVESEPVRDAPADIGIDFAQGSHIGKSFPAPELEVPGLPDAGRADGTG